MADHFRVTPADLTTHAAAVDDRARGVTTAVDAAKSVVLDAGAFGVLCAPIGVVLNGVAALGMVVGGDRAKSLGKTATALRDSAKDYQDRDHHHAQAMGALTAAIDEHDAGGTPHASASAAKGY